MSVSRTKVRGFKSPMSHRSFSNDNLIWKVSLGIHYNDFLQLKPLFTSYSNALAQKHSKTLEIAIVIVYAATMKKLKTLT